MTESSSAGIRRRTLLNTAAWSAPVVAVAAGAPAAAASTAGYDVEFASPEKGSTFFVYNSDYTVKYAIGEPMGFRLVNLGDEDWTGPAQVRFTYDNDLFQLTGVQISRIGAEETRHIDISSDDVTVDGNAAHATFSITEMLPAHTEHFDPQELVVSMEYTAEVEYPNDSLDHTPVPHEWVATIPGNAGGESLVVGGREASFEEDVHPWGLELTATAEKIQTSECAMTVPTQATILSVGPAGTPGDVGVSFNADPAVVTDVQIATVTLNGASLSGVTAVQEDSSTGWWTIELGQPLQGGDEVELSLALSHNDSASPSDSAEAGLSAWSDGSNNTDRRYTHTSVSYDNDDCAA